MSKAYKKFINSVVAVHHEVVNADAPQGLFGGEKVEPSPARLTLRPIGAPERAKAHVVGVVLASDLPATGGFACSDARLTRLHKNVVWSQRANFLWIPTDCPQRERTGWTGDAQVFAPAAANNAEVHAFLARWMRNVRVDQREDGSVMNAVDRKSVV